MNDSTEVSRKLAKLNVQKISIHWSAGGDDGCVDEVTIEPQISIERELHAILEDFAWDVYSEDFDGGTAGEFSSYGNVEIEIQPDGKYQINADNTYEESRYIGNIEDDLPEFTEETKITNLIKVLQ